MQKRIDVLSKCICHTTVVVDGDTIKADLELPFGIFLKEQSIRLFGIDTPESRTKDPIEKKFGLAAKKRLGELIDGPLVLEVQAEKGKYGRHLGVLRRDNGLSINDMLVLERFAVAYNGKSKEDIAEKHKENRRYLIDNGIVS